MKFNIRIVGVLFSVKERIIGVVCDFFFIQNNNGTCTVKIRNLVFCKFQTDK